MSARFYYLAGFYYKKKNAIVNWNKEHLGYLAKWKDRASFFFVKYQKTLAKSKICDKISI